VVISISMASWLFWCIGTILIVCSWFNLVSIQLGWFGFAIAVAGSIISRLVTKPEGIDYEAQEELNPTPVE
jgi:hypothetical protein